MDRGVDRRVSVDRGVDRRASVDRGVDRRVSVDRGVDRRASVDRGVDRRASVDRGVDRRVSVDRGVDRRVSVDRGVDRGVDRRASVDRGVDRRASVDRGVDRRVSVDRGVDRRVSVDRGVDRRVSVDRGVDRRVSVDRGVDKMQTTDAGATSGSGLAGASGETVRDDPSLRDIMTMLVSLNSKFDNTQSDIQEVKRSNEQMKTETEGMKETVHDRKAENDRLRKQTTDMQERLDTLTIKADDLECRSKRHNVIFYGLHRPDCETGQDCEDALQDFLTDKLELSRTIEFDRVHRLNSKPNSLVIARCTYFKDKNTILKARYKLKGSNIFLGEDFSVRVREIRKKLGPHLKAARDQGKRVTMIFDHLLINGKKIHT